MAHHTRVIRQPARRARTDLDLYARGTGHLRRTLETLGIKRRARDVTPGNALLELYELEGKLVREDKTDDE